jgi:hypothetical protein
MSSRLDSNGKANSVGSKGQRLIEAHAEFIVESYPEGEFVLSGRISDLPTVDVPVAGTHRQLREADCVAVVGRRHAPNQLGGDKPVHVYQVPEHVRERAQGYLDGGWSPCPCGHRGLQNYTDGYECGWDECDRLFERSEVSP